MSVSKWAYKPEKCDGDYCCGDCDYCNKAEDEEEPEIRYTKTKIIYVGRNYKL